MRLANKVAIITGGGRGIGRATALAFVKEGAKLVLAATTDSEISSVADEVRELGGEAISVVTDVTDKGQVQALAGRTLETFGQIDVLVNNAGVAIHNLIPNILEEDWDRNIAVNLKGVFLCTQAVFQHMCDRETGHIINVSSVSGKIGHANGGAYCASKWGVNGFTEVTFNEGKPYGVKASVVCPGPTDTQMRRENHPDDIIDNLTLSEDIAEAILFLATQPKQAHTLETVVRTPLM